MVLKGRQPKISEKNFMQSVAELGCIVCRNLDIGYVPAEIHHIYGKTKKDSHLFILPLCFDHHRAGHDGEKHPFVSRHPYKKRFIKTYGDELTLLKQVQLYLI